MEKPSTLWHGSVLRFKKTDESRALRAVRNNHRDYCCTPWPHYFTLWHHLKWHSDCVTPLTGWKRQRSIIWPLLNILCFLCPMQKKGVDHLKQILFWRQEHTLCLNMWNNVTTAGKLFQSDGALNIKGFYPCFSDCRDGKEVLWYIYCSVEPQTDLKWE